MSAELSGHRWPWARGAALLVVVAAVLLGPFGLGPSEFAQSVENALHAPLFAGVAIAVLKLYRLARPRASVGRSYAVAFVAAVAIGAAGEVAQGLGGTRHAELTDLLNDACGAVLGLGWRLRSEAQVRVSRRRRRRVMLAMVAACALVASPLVMSGMRYAKRWQQLPELVTWSSSLGRHFVRPGTTPAALAEIPQRWSKGHELALHVGSGDGNWVGITIEEPWPDWRGYDYLEIDVVNPTDRTLELIARIEDRQHNDEYADRFNKPLQAPAQSRVTLRIPISEIEAGPVHRRLDLSQVARLVLFQSGERGSQAYFLCALRLAR